uniref:Uncharacterized protein n=1 Tax=Aegilops tauschii subsp. strangulata TaxID=200361 RepID=A0A453JNT4_AEGTS
GVETRVAVWRANSISAGIDNEKNGDLGYRSKFCGCCAALSETSLKGRCSVHGSSKFCEAHSGEEKGKGRNLKRDGRNRLLCNHGKPCTRNALAHCSVTLYTDTTNILWKKLP